MFVQDKPITIGSREFKMEFCGFRAAGPERRIRKILESILAVAPYWVRDVQVFYSEEDAGKKLVSISSDPEDLSVTIYVYPRFENFPDEEVVYSLIHEIAHTVFAPLSNFARASLIEPMKERNPELYAMADKEWIERLESATNTLTNIFEEFLGQPTYLVDPVRVDLDALNKLRSGQLLRIKPPGEKLVKTAEDGAIL